MKKIFCQLEKVTKRLDIFMCMDDIIYRLKLKKGDYKMKAQRNYWLKYKDNSMECLFRCFSLSEIKKYISDNNIKEKDIIKIIRYI